MLVPRDPLWLSGCSPNQPWCYRRSRHRAHKGPFNSLPHTTPPFYSKIAKRAFTLFSCAHLSHPLPIGSGVPLVAKSKLLASSTGPLAPINGSLPKPSYINMRKNHTHIKSHTRDSYRKNPKQPSILGPPPYITLINHTSQATTHLTIAKTLKTITSKDTSALNPHPKQLRCRRKMNESDEDFIRRFAGLQTEIGVF